MPRLVSRAGTERLGYVHRQRTDEGHSVAFDDDANIWSTSIPFPWRGSQGIAPGTHDVEVNLSGGTAVIAAFEGPVESEQILIGATQTIPKRQPSWLLE